MDKWLKTGQMIDKLNTGKIAKNTTGQYVKRQPYGFIWCEEDGSYLENRYLPINDVTLEMQWKITENSDD